MKNVSVQDVRDGCARVLAGVANYREFGQETMLCFNNMPANKVEQIQVIRAVTKLGLKEAKDLVDSIDPQVRGGRFNNIPFKGSLRTARANLEDYSSKYSVPVFRRFSVDNIVAATPDEAVIEEGLPTISFKVTLDMQLAGDRQLTSAELERLIRNHPDFDVLMGFAMSGVVRELLDPQIKNDEIECVGVSVVDI